jgi:hypothetical protein
MDPWMAVKGAHVRARSVHVPRTKILTAFVSLCNVAAYFTMIVHLVHA